MTCVYSLTFYKVLFQSAKFANCSLKKENSSITFSFLFKDFSLKENKLQSSVQCKITGFAQEKPTLKGIVKIKGKNENLTQYFKNLNRCYWLLTFEKLKNKKKVTRCLSFYDAIYNNKVEPTAFLYQAVSVSI